MQAFGQNLKESALLLSGLSASPAPDTASELLDLSPDVLRWYGTVDVDVDADASNCLRVCSSILPSKMVHSDMESQRTTMSSMGMEIKRRSRAQLSLIIAPY